MYDMILTASKRIPWIVISKTIGFWKLCKKKRTGDVSENLSELKKENKQSVEVANALDEIDGFR